MCLCEPVEPSIAFNGRDRHWNFHPLLRNIGSAAQRSAVVVENRAARAAAVLAVAAGFDDCGHLLVGKELCHFVDQFLPLHIGAQPGLHLWGHAACAGIHRELGDVLQFLLAVAVEKGFVYRRHLAHGAVEHHLAGQFALVLVEYPSRL